MQCARCHAENRVGRGFCSSCGLPLGLLCPHCKFANEAGDRYCGGCGAPLDNPPPAPRTAEVRRPEVPRVPPVARGGPRSTFPERRQLTVMFCDLVGSTALSAHLDPEDLRVVLRLYQDTCTAVIERFEGHVSRYFGDGILVLFGYPRAHEDDAARAARAGLGILEALAALEPIATPSGPFRVRVRVGIASGVVVVGDLIGEGASEEEAVVGETPNLAARMLSAADPDAVVVAPSTRHLLGDLFDYEDLGSREIHGVPGPLRVSRVVREKRALTRFEATHGAGLTPLVGREDEMALLLRRWERAHRGEGQVVLISGEAGIGKSRLARSLDERLGGTSHLHLRWQCSPYQKNTPLHPVAAQLEHAAAFTPEDTAVQRLAKLEALVAKTTTHARETVALFAQLLSIPLGSGYALGEMSAQLEKERTLAALTAHMEALAGQRSLLLVFEDLQWADATSLELLDLLVERVPQIRVLALLLFRPDFAPPWLELPHVTLLSLNRLTREEAASMVEQLGGGKRLPASVTDQIIDITDGVPLFVEELTKSVLESGVLREEHDHYIATHSLPARAIPATLHESLMARLDRFSQVRDVAQTGSVIGREFSHELLGALYHGTPQELQQSLDRLVEAQLLFRRGVPPHASYSFKHALVHEAAYESLLRSRRQQLHAQIAHTLEARYPEFVETKPELLAHHYTGAGFAEKAVGFWLEAGRRASARSAHVEAVGHLRKGLEVLTLITDSSARDRRELSLLTALGTELISTEGAGSPEVRHTYDRALDLCARLPASPLHFAALWGQWRLCGDERAALRRADELLELARGQNDPDLLLQAHHAQWATHFLLGEPLACIEHVRDGLALYSEKRHRGDAALYGGHDTAVCGHGQAALALWTIGYPQQALSRLDEAFTRARALRHSPSLAHALDYALQLHFFLGVPERVLEYAAESEVLAAEHGFSEYRARANAFRAWADARLARGEQALAELRRAVEEIGEYRTAMGKSEDLAIFFHMLAEVCGLNGLPGEGLGLVDEGLAMVEERGLRQWEAELQRCRGSLLLASGDQHGAVACFERGRDAAHQQSALMLELRGVLSWAELLRAGGREEEAQGELSAVYGRFTEGFETPDLQAAGKFLGAVA